MTDRDRFDRNRDSGLGQQQRRPWDRNRYQSENSNYYPDEDRDRGSDRGYSRLGGAGEEEYERYSHGGYSQGGYQPGQGAREYGRDYAEERSSFGSERGYGQDRGGYGHDRGSVQYGYGSRDWGRQRERGGSGLGSQYDRAMRDFGERTGYEYERGEYGQSGPRGGGNQFPSGNAYSTQRAQSWGNQGQGGQGGQYGQQRMERGRFAGHGPKGYKRSDERIREDVCDALMMHPDIDASEIEIKVNDGEVSLSGTVQDREDKWLAEQLCEGIPGVRDVNNTVRTKRSGSEQSSSSSTESARNGRSNYPGTGGASQGGASNTRA